MKYLVVTLIFFFTLLPLHAFEATSLQLLYSNSFDGDAFIYDTKDGKKTTLTVEHFRTYSLGDFFMFVDATDGTRFDGTTSSVYTEIAPRISFSKLLGKDFSTDIVQDVYIATQVNLGDDYRAYLYGLGIDLNLPFFQLFSVNIYNKTENITNDDTYQVTTVYKSQELYGFHATGFIDMTKRDFSTQNQILFNLDTLLNLKEKIFLGIEWLYYDYNAKGTSSKTSAIQAMIKYNF